MISFHPLKPLSESLMWSLTKKVKDLKEMNQLKKSVIILIILGVPFVIVSDLLSLVCFVEIEIKEVN